MYSTGLFFPDAELVRIFCIRRRTADVRTVGYVECFVLAKEDVLSAIRDYPEAQVSGFATFVNRRISLGNYHQVFADLAGACWVTKGG